MNFGWYGLVDREVIGPFSTMDSIALSIGPDWRMRVFQETGEDPWRVGYTELPNGGHVSTVFLGLDQRHFGDGPPIIFETMIFPECEWCCRCSTWEEAVMQHEEAVVAATKVTPPRDSTT